VKRLVKAYGKDIYYIVKGGEPPKEAEASTEDTLLEAKKAIESARWFFEE
jgi:hypothetical protein